jgi:hypothetical protein
MGDNNTAESAEDKKKRQRRKQFKRMGKILGTVWDWDADFQDRGDSDVDETAAAVLCLTDVGQRVDDQVYRLGRLGWEDFSLDLSSVYHRHIQG